MKILKKLDHVLANFVVSFKDCTFKESDDDFSFNFQHLMSAFIKILLTVINCT